jgi:hypothetical protein
MTVSTRVQALLAVAVFAVSACGIQPDAGPRDIPDEDQTVIIADGSTGDTSAAGGDRIFLVGSGEDKLLRSVPREAVSPEDLIRILLLGPNEDEIEAQFTTAIPSTTELLSVRSQGNVLFIDLTEELTELTGGGLTQALAQIVYTANQLEGVEAVQVTVNGSALSWPKGTGDSTTGTLRIYDYPGAVQTSQPAYPAVPSGV